MTPTLSPERKDEQIACSKGNLTDQQQKETITALNSFDKEVEKSMENANPKKCHAEKCASNSGKDCTCDSFHTFDELYDHRITLFIALCKKLQRPEHYGDARNIAGNDGQLVWRSNLHHDGTNFCGWFIMGIGKEKGKQISYHLPLSRWKETNFAETLERAPEWDGHTSDDVLNRLKTL